jgi:hypothetical protein
MPRKRQPSTVRVPCPGGEGKKRPCWAVQGSQFCSKHDPAKAHLWKESGRLRHPRFAKAVLIDGHVFNKSKAPTLAHIVDRAMGIADSAEAGRIDPRVAQAAVTALRLAAEVLRSERDRTDKLKFAWEREVDAARARAEATDPSPPAGEPSADPVIPPWMKPRQTPDS